MSRRLALLIPTYNGGSLLHESVLSCGTAGLDPRCDAVLIVDNGSNDGSIESLPTAVGNGVPVSVSRNAENVGRIGNWNQALRRAEEEGFAFAAFLFVGDLLLSGTALPDLLAEMEREATIAGLAPNCFLREDRTLIATAQRIRLQGPRATVPANRLLNTILSAGALLLGPLQANVFRLRVPHALTFDPLVPTHTDQLATVSFLHQNDGTVTLIDRPFMGWRTHTKRFHTTMGVEPRLGNDLDFLRRSADLCELRLDWPKVHASLFLQYVNNWLAGREYRARDIRLVWDLLRRAPGGIRYGEALRLVLRRITTGRGLVSFAATR